MENFIDDFINDINTLIDDICMRHEPKFDLKEVLQDKNLKDLKRIVNNYAVKEYSKMKKGIDKNFK